MHLCYRTLCQKQSSFSNSSLPHFPNNDHTWNTTKLDGALIRKVGDSNTSSPSPPFPVLFDSVIQPVLPIQPSITVTGNKQKVLTLPMFWFNWTKVACEHVGCGIATTFAMGIAYKALSPLQSWTSPFPYDIHAKIYDFNAWNTTGSLKYGFKLVTKRHSRPWDLKKYPFPWNKPKFVYSFKIIKVNKRKLPTAEDTARASVLG